MMPGLMYKRVAGIGIVSVIVGNLRLLMARTYVMERLSLVVNALHGIVQILNYGGGMGILVVNTGPR